MIEFETVRRQPTVNLSALIDIAFILVIFIVLGATFQRLQDVEVSLPEANARHNANEDGLQVVVHADGSVEVDGNAIVRASVRDMLAMRVRDHSSLLLIADRSASVQVAVEILADAQTVGFSSVAIATRKPAG